MPRRPLRTLAAALAVLLASPLAAASWKAHGALEPDTPHDRQGGMFADPDRDPDPAVRKVYFHAFQAVPQTSANPNAAALGSRILAAPSAHHRAILGVWKDCNRDGYVGQAESALQDYRVELLPPDHVCPPQAYAGSPVHNDGRWVSELLSIGAVDPCEFEDDATRRARCGGMPPFALNERVHHANGTRVWGDVGAPGAPPEAECALAPLPQGATTGTGALVGYLDCQGSRGVARSVNGIDPDGSRGLGFDDPSRPEESDSLLNQPFPVTPFGRGDEPGLVERGAPRRSATVWDCGDPKGGADVRDPHGPRDVAVTDPSGGPLAAETFPWVIVHALTGVGFADEDDDPSTPGVLRVPLTDGEGSYAWAPAPAARLDDADASWWDALAHAADGPQGDCDASTPGRLDAAHPGDRIESGQPPVRDAVKDRASLVFAFFDGHRGVNPRFDDALGPTAPSDGGLAAFDHDRTGDGPLWSAAFETSQDPQLVDRADLGPAPARWFTYYARIGDDLPVAVSFPGAGGTYGGERCAAGADPKGWVCDASLWWRDRDGRDARPRYALGQPMGGAVGEPYHLRDVDCYDGSVARGSGLHASLVPFSQQPACA